MFKSQLIDLLRIFSPEEIRELQLFVASPFFNRGDFVKETQALLLYIATIDDFSEKRLDRSLASKAVFPQTQASDGKMNKVMSELYKLSKEFLYIRKCTDKGNEFRQLLAQASIYRIRLLENRYTNAINKLETYQKEVPYRDLDFFERQFLLDFELHTYGYLHNRKKDDIHIQKALESLDLYYFSLKTELLNRYLLQQKIALLDITEEITEAIKESHLPERYADAYPVLCISYKIFRLLEKEQPDVSEFEELHGLLREHESEVQPELLKTYYTFIRNFCVLLVNGGQSEFLPMLFRLQKEHYERGYMHHYGGKISATAFLSLCNAALKLGENEWAKEFVHVHENRVLDDNESQDYYHLILANYHFHVGAFDTALDILPPSFQDLDFHLFSRRLELKIYYEQNSDLLPFKIDAFKMYLSRASQKVLSASAKERNSNFVNLLFQLHGTNRGDTPRARRLIERIRQKQTVTDREWLLEKAEELCK